MPGQPPRWPTRQRRAHKVDIGGSGNIAQLQNLEALVDQRIEEPGDLNSWDIYGIYIWNIYVPESVRVNSLIVFCSSTLLWL